MKSTAEVRCLFSSLSIPNPPRSSVFVHYAPRPLTRVLRQKINASPPPAQFQADPWGITSRGSFACGLQASCVTQADNFWFGSDREELVVLNGGIRGFTVGSAHSSGRQSVGRGDCFSW